MRQDYFENYVEHAFGDYKQADFKINQIIHNYTRFFPNDLDSKILDIGIGRGEMLTVFKKIGFRDYLGIDISPSTVSFCRTIGLNCIQIQNTEKYLSERQGQFDLITLCDVLEHIEKNNVVEFVKSVNIALKNNGIIIIQVPNMQTPDPALHRYNDMTHEIGFTEHSLKQLLMLAGFHDIKFCPYEIIIGWNLINIIRILVRSGYLNIVRIRRLINGDLNPKILSPVFFAVAKKNE